VGDYFAARTRCANEKISAVKLLKAVAIDVDVACF